MSTWNISRGEQCSTKSQIDLECMMAMALTTRGRQLQVMKVKFSYLCFTKTFKTRWQNGWSPPTGIASSCDHHGHLVLTVFAKHWYQNCIWSFLSQDILLLLKNKNISPNVGLEPTTLRLRVSCSTDWASRALVEIMFLKVSLLLLITMQDIFVLI